MSLTGTTTGEALYPAFIVVTSTEAIKFVSNTGVDAAEAQALIDWLVEIWFIGIVSNIHILVKYRGKFFFIFTQPCNYFNNLEYFLIFTI
ncbi:hypothetical protein [Candidatus Nitrosocosmicus hydrocola]|uniref:hypothetical protein n=1 Tax=Candidatus Nitrosocosmicus hydrocola TaxID=1826872 RepID=UPI0011E5FF3B|nr:hypothetical protein [Candidatus Nitrosocosmicus hydrocola]